MERPKKKVKKGRNKKVKKEETEVEDEAPFDFMNFSDYIQAAGDLPEVAYMNYYKLADFDVNIVLSSLYLSGMEYFEELTKSLNNDLLMDIDMIRERFDVDKMQKECYYLNDGDLLELNKVIMRIRAYSLLYKEENQQYKGIMKEFLDKIEKHCEVSSEDRDLIVKDEDDVKFISTLFSGLDFYAQLSLFRNVFKLRCCFEKGEEYKETSGGILKKLHGKNKFALEKIISELRGDKELKVVLEQIPEICMELDVNSEIVLRDLKVVCFSEDIDFSFSGLCFYLGKDALVHILKDVKLSN